MDRPNWDQYFMEMAELASKRSTCLRRKVGAVLVKDRRILATGYNGAPKKLPHCEETGCLREQKNVPSGQRHEICRGIHAEQNLIAQSAVHGVKTEGATVYCTNQPCSICTKLLINAGIKKIYYKNPYNDEFTKKLLDQSEIEYKVIK
ncbi:MAG TPA: cytidine/deoxycytidylate deaminase family protein [Halanaerobiales bacterium]|nr:cytidine/deoxycytidylate deaminase family protein [Halanaerobiales bacterium]